MWKYIFNWHQKTKYNNLQSRIQSCGLYFVDEFGLVLPTIRTIITFPDEAMIKRLAIGMHDSQAIGTSVLTALDYAAEAKKTLTQVDYEAVQVNFLRDMERYRESIGVGKRRFESQLKLIEVTRISEEIMLNRRYRAHGKFAFAGTSSVNDQMTIPKTASERDIGEAILALCKKKK